jgi:pentapeptide MXKDX repeat protein
VRKLFQLIAVTVMSLGLGLTVALVGGCNSSTKDTAETGKMDSGKMDSGKMANDKMGGGKMNNDKMGADKMGGDKMGGDKGKM